MKGKRIKRWLCWSGGAISVIVLVVAALTVQRHLDWWRYPLRGVLPVRRVTAPDALAAQIVAGAKAQEGTHYNARYLPIAYPNGDVPSHYGACTDVVVRSLRAAGTDLQRLIHEDMKRNFHLYPKLWAAATPNPNIDHRRVPNQMRFFERHGQVLTTEVSRSTVRQWQPGDLVYWKTKGRTGYHTGVLSDGVNSDGIPLVIHNGSICVEADCLTRWPIIGHYRYPPRRWKRASAV